MTISVKLEGQQDLPAKAKKRKRKLTRPTTPVVEALYFRVAINLSKRETALFMWAMGRSALSEEEMATMFATSDVLP